jgi:hypothetical protein
VDPMSAEQMPHPARQWLQDIPGALCDVRHDLGNARTAAAHLLPFVWRVTAERERDEAYSEAFTIGLETGHFDLGKTRTSLPLPLLHLNQRPPGTRDPGGRFHALGSDPWPIEVCDRPPNQDYCPRSRAREVCGGTLTGSQRPAGLATRAGRDHGGSPNSRPATAGHAFTNSWHACPSDPS